MLVGSFFVCADKDHKEPHNNKPVTMSSGKGGSKGKVNKVATIIEDRILPPPPK